VQSSSSRLTALQRDDLREVGVNKLCALLGRGVARDLVDL
jgi:hypothetical protein